MKGGRTQRGNWFSYMTDSQPDETNIRRGGASKVIRRRAFYLLRRYSGIWPGKKNGALPDSAPMRGFTVVETMIFLTVSAALFLGAMRLVSGQQERAEFNYGIQEFSGLIRDLANDVSTGFYPYDPGTTCFVTGTSSAQGTNSACIFIGRVLHFGANDIPGNPTNNSMRIYTVTGRRQVTVSGATRDAFNLTESETRPLSTSQEIRIPGGIRLEWVRIGGEGGTDIGAVGYFMNFTKYQDASQGLLESEARNVDVIPINGTGLNQSQFQIAAAIRNNTAASPINPPQGVTACLESAGGDFYVLMNLGGNLSQLSNDIQILSGECP